MQVQPSMGTVGDAYDNAMAESFFASLEGELIERQLQLHFVRLGILQMATSSAQLYRTNPQQIQ